MKNIHVLPTDKPSELYINIQGDLSKSNSLLLRPKSRNIYITSEEEIKEGDWWLNLKTNDADKCTHKSEVLLYNSEKYEHIKKIILTTDQDLIKDGVQSIPDDFLEWFVENPSCESVEVKPLLSNNGNVLFGYKIIIPKEKDYFPDTYIGSILSSEDIVKDITELENQSFEGWTTDSIKGYLLACKNIKEKLI